MTRPVHPLLEELDPDLLERTEEVPQPDFTRPMLATLHDEPFDREGWIYERKLDGVRLLAFRKDGTVRLMTRNEKDRSATWFEIRDALAALDAPDFVADGEVVTFDGDVTSFARLQGRMQIEEEEEARERAEDLPVVFYLFDLLHLAGRDVTGLPLRSRKSLLRRAIEWDDPIRFTEHRTDDGVAYWEEACSKGWEGVIAKDGESRYVHGRSRDWLKFKCVHRQELVVGGFTEPEGERTGFGALLVGYHRDGELVYAGKVGTGFDDDTLEELRSRMDRLERKTSPFDEGDAGGEDVHWITPELVAEVGFTEWTDDGKLRHPRFVGLRHDKSAEDVVRERPT